MIGRADEQVKKKKKKKKILNKFKVCNCLDIKI